MWPIDTVPVAHVDLYAHALPRAHVRRLAGRDHQLGNRLSEVAADIRRLDERSAADATRNDVRPGRSHGAIE